MNQYLSFSPSLRYSECLRNANVIDGWRRLRGQRRDLVKFDDVARRLGIHVRHAPKLAEVPVCQILGSVGRAQNFTREFLPRACINRERWESIVRAMRKGVELPPVELYRIGDVYFVIDGHHRTSVARANGCDAIDAYVTTLDSPVWLTVEDFNEDRWLENIARQGQEESVMEYIEIELIKQQHEERVRQVQRERLARLVQSQQPSLILRLLVWTGDRLIYLGSRLKAHGEVTPDTAPVGEA